MLHRTTIVLILVSAITLGLAASVLAYTPQPDPAPRYSSKAILANGKLYWYCGYGATYTDNKGRIYNENRQSGMSIYDPGTNSWVSSKWDGTGPAGLDNNGNGYPNVEEGSWGGTCQAFAYNDDGDSTKELFQNVGYPCWTGELWRYDPDTDKWSLKNHNNRWAGLRRGTSVLDESTGTVYIMGGASTVALPSGFGKYDFSTDTYTDLPDAPVEMVWHVGAFINGKLYYAGGQQRPVLPPEAPPVDFSTTIWEVNPLANPPTWTAMPNPLLKGVNHAAVAVYNNKMYICGGRTEASPGVFEVISDVQEFDPVTKVVTKVGDLPMAVQGCAAVIAPDGTFYFGSGSQVTASQYGGPINLDWRTTDFNVKPWTWAGNIADDPAYFCYRDWYSGSTISGVVTNPTGGRAGGAVVGVKYTTNAMADANWYTTANSNGEYSIEVPDGSVYVSAWTPECAPSADVLVVVGGGGVIRDLALTKYRGTNLALNMPAYASSSYPDPGCTPDKGVDGTFDTQWVSAQGATGEGYFIVDLGSDQELTGVSCFFGGWYPSDYEVDVMLDADWDPWNPTVWLPGDYTTVYSMSGGTGGYEITPMLLYADPIRFDTPVTARAIRVLFEKTYDGLPGESMRELVAHSTTEEMPPVHCILSGVVTDPEGKPAGGAAVGVKLESDAMADAEWYATANSEGEYSVEFDVLPGPVYVAAWNMECRPTADYVVVVGGGPVTRDLELTEYKGTNLALNMPVIASSIYPDPSIAAEYAVDGTVSTQWASPEGAIGEEYFIVDLGSDQELTGISCLFGGWYPSDYQVDVMPASSGDPLIIFNWVPGAYTTVYSAANRHGGYEITPMVLYADPIRLDPTVTARGIRVLFEKPYDGLVGESIRELVAHSTTQQTPPIHSIYEARRADDGTPVSLIGKFVSEIGGQTTAPPYGGADWDTAFYIQEPDRSSGIRVEYREWLYPGHKVDVYGTVATNAHGERYVDWSTVTNWGFEELPPPLGMTNKSLVTELAQGLLAKAFGKVLSLTADGFMLDDGSDPTGVGVRVLSGNVLPVVEDFVSFTGIVGKREGELVVQCVWPDWTTGTVGPAGWLKVWLMNGYWNVDNPGGDPYYWQVANIDNDFIGEAAIAAFPGLVTGGKTWFSYYQMNNGAGIPLWLPDYVQAFTPPAFAGQKVAYSMIYVYSPVEYSESSPYGLAELRLGSDDGVKVIINGVVSPPADLWVGVEGACTRGCQPDEDFPAVSLNQGWNSVLVKVNQVDPTMSMVVRFMCDEPGSPGSKIPIPGMLYSLYPM
jgi:hypothetical protein